MQTVICIPIKQWYIGIRAALTRLFFEMAVSLPAKVQAQAGGWWSVQESDMIPLGVVAPLRLCVGLPMP